jgi:aldose 1-epimerase
VTTSTSAPPTLRLHAGDYTASVSPLGAGLCSLTWRDRDLILPYSPPSEPWRGQGELLLPWPNRIDGGRYTFHNRDYQLEISEEKFGNAIHGLTRHAAWTVDQVGARHAVLHHRLEGAPGYPWRLDLAVAYHLSADDGLTVEITATNADTSPLPYGNGAHPYLTLGGSVDAATLHLPAARRLLVDERMIPDGPPRPVAGTGHDFRAPRRIGSTVLDTAFTEITERDDEGRAWVTLSDAEAGVALWADSGYRWLQAFTAESPASALHRRGLAVEPMTCPPNAFATGTDLTVLDPGASSASTYGIRAVAPLLPARQM